MCLKKKLLLSLLSSLKAPVDWLQKRFRQGALTVMIIALKIEKNSGPFFQVTIHAYILSICSNRAQPGRDFSNFNHGLNLVLNNKMMSADAKPFKTIANSVTLNMKRCLFASFLQGWIRKDILWCASGVRRLQCGDSLHSWQPESSEKIILIQMKMN